MNTEAKELKVSGRLKKLRIENNLSQDALAKKAGLERKTINRIENGHFSPSLASLISTQGEAIRNSGRNLNMDTTTITYDSKVLDPKKSGFQRKVASALISEIFRDIADIEEITPELILDMMGVIGVEFSIGDKAFLEFIGASYSG
jgi:DNA-binding XRE family transcriptional regulator